MVSEMVVAEIEKIERECGVHVPPRDVVRLNALGLKVDLPKSSAAAYDLPRVAFLGSKLAFREPTVGHSIWIDSVAAYCRKDDAGTILAIVAFALSRAHDALPDPTDRAACSKAIDRFTKTDLAPFTFAQIQCAVTYASYGCDAVAREYPDAPEREDEDSETSTVEIPDTPSSIGAGVVVETLAMGLGVSVREICGMTIAQVRKVQRLALLRLGIKNEEVRRTNALGDYYVTRDNIKARLLSEAGKKA